MNEIFYNSEDCEYWQRNSSTGEERPFPDESTPEQKRLQVLADELRDDNQYHFEIFVTDDDEWYAIPDECRYIGDPGEYLGWNSVEAEKSLRMLLG